VDTEPVGLDEWERERREALADFAATLDSGHLDLDKEPFAFLPILDQFLTAQDYATLSEDDTLSLKTYVAAYLAQVLIVNHHAHWEIRTDQRGRDYVLVMTGLDGQQHAVSPLDVVYDDFTQLPPVLVRMLATAERVARLEPAAQE
jgi:hypothetical protein